MAEVISIDYLVPSIISSILLLLLREIFAYKKVLSFKYILTPLVTFSIILVVIVSLNNSGVNKYRVLILSALLMSLVADTLLMIEEINLLKPGIIFFMLAHIIYLTAFANSYSFKSWNLLVALITVLFIKKSSGIFLEGAGEMRKPVFIYIILISLMVYFAVTGLNNGFSLKSLFVMSGALLFVSSDLVLAYNLFVKNIPHSTVYTWALYAPAQMLFALSCM